MKHAPCVALPACVFLRHIQSRWLLWVRTVLYFYTLGRTYYFLLLLFYFFFSLLGRACFRSVSQHTNTPLLPPLNDEKKTRVFYGFQSSLIQSIEKVLFLFIDILFFLLSPNLSRSKTIVKTLWPRQTLQSGYPFHFLCQKRKRFFCEKKLGAN